MINRRTNFAPTIFKDQYVINICTRTQFGCSLRPQIDHASHSGCSEACKRLVMIWRVQHDLAPIVWHWRPTICKVMCFVRLRRLKTANAKRAIGGGQIGTILSRTNYMHNSARAGINAFIARATVREVVLSSHGTATDGTVRSGVYSTSASDPEAHR
jgi:hypothetical protein